MTDEIALRAAIRANTNDPVVRLVYADWLEERGREGGDLIRLMVGSNPWRNHRAVMNWFSQHAGWPLPDDELAAWLVRAVESPRWPSQTDRLASIAIIVERTLLDDDRIDRTDRQIIETAALEPARIEPFRFISAAGRIAGFTRDSPALGAGEAIDGEYVRLVNVIGWGWLTLPPIFAVPERITIPPDEPVANATPTEEAARPSWWRRLFDL